MVPGGRLATPPGNLREEHLVVHVGLPEPRRPNGAGASGGKSRGLGGPHPRASGGWVALAPALPHTPDLRDQV